MVYLKRGVYRNGGVVAQCLVHSGYVNVSDKRVPIWTLQWVLFNLDLWHLSVKFSRYVTFRLRRIFAFADSGVCFRSYLCNSSLSPYRRGSSQSRVGHHFTHGLYGDYGHKRNKRSLQYLPRHIHSASAHIPR